MSTAWEELVKHSLKCPLFSGVGVASSCPSVAVHQSGVRNVKGKEVSASVTAETSAGRQKGDQVRFNEEELEDKIRSKMRKGIGLGAK